jgi:hypothetical protein
MYTTLLRAALIVADRSLLNQCGRFAQKKGRQTAAQICARGDRNY